MFPYPSVFWKKITMTTIAACVWANGVTNFILYYIIQYSINVGAIFANVIDFGVSRYKGVLGINYIYHHYSGCASGDNTEARRPL